MYGVAGEMLALEERLILIDLLIATIKHFIKRVQFFEMDW